MNTYRKPVENVARQVSMGIRNGLETVLRWGKYRRKMKKGLCDYLM
jgi:hypothetical protein